METNEPAMTLGLGQEWGLTVGLYRDLSAGPLGQSEGRLALFEDGVENPAPEFTGWDDIEAAKRAGAVVFAVARVNGELAMRDGGRAGALVYSRELRAQLADPLEEWAYHAVDHFNAWSAGEVYSVRITDAQGEVVAQQPHQKWLGTAMKQGRELYEFQERNLRAGAHRRAHPLRDYVAHAPDGARHEFQARSMADALGTLPFEPVNLGRA